MFMEECCSIINQKLEELPTKGKILIWGAGENAVRLFQYTELLKYNISYIVDNRLYGQTFFGKTIVKPENIPWEGVDVVIISAFVGKEGIENDLYQRYNFQGVVLTIHDNLQAPFYSLVAKKSVNLNDKIAPILQRNSKYKNCHAGERAFILCTGPSIATMDLTKLRNEKTIAVNSFYLHKDCQLISPDYYCEPAFEEFVSIDLLAEHLRNMQQNAINAHYFFGIKEKENVEKVKGFENRCVNYMSYAAIPYYENLDIDLTSVVMGPQSVSIMALEIALYMGFQEIYLLGTEHSELISGRYTHFYQYSESVASKARGSENIYGVNDTPFDIQLNTIYNLWKQYKIIKAIAMKKRINIYNATKGGILDIFERVDFENIFT